MAPDAGRLPGGSLPATPIPPLHEAEILRAFGALLVQHGAPAAALLAALADRFRAATAG